MKNYIWLVFIGFLLATACEKDQMNDNVELISTEVSKVLHVDVDNNMLIFDSKEHYEVVLEELGNLSFSDWDLWEKSIDFKSLRRFYNQSGVLSENPIADPFFATLLNPDLRIQIGENIFEINPEEKTVAVVERGDNINFYKTSQVFNFDDDILSILEGEEVVKGTRCDTKNVYYNYWVFWDRNNQSVNCQVHYYRAGLYNSLYAEIEKDATSTPISFKMYLLVDATWDDGNNSGTYTAPSPRYGENNAYWSMFRSSRALRDYYVKMRFQTEDWNYRDSSPVVYYLSYDKTIENECYNP